MRKYMPDNQTKKAEEIVKKDLQKKKIFNLKR